MRYADSQCTYTEEFHDGGRHFYVYTGKCVLSGKPVTVKIPAAELYAYRRGEFIQDAMRSLSAGEREFLMSGICEEAFDNAFADEEDEADPLDDDRDQENPSEYGKDHNWSKHDFDNDPDWR